MAMVPRPEQQPPRPRWANPRKTPPPNHALPMCSFTHWSIGADLTVSAGKAAVPKARDLGGVALGGLAGRGTRETPDVDSLALSEPATWGPLSARMHTMMAPTTHILAQHMGATRAHASSGASQAAGARKRMRQEGPGHQAIPAPSPPQLCPPSRSTEHACVATMIFRAQRPPLLLLAPPPPLPFPIPHIL